MPVKLCRLRALRAGARRTRPHAVQWHASACCLGPTKPPADVLGYSGGPGRPRSAISLYLAFRQTSANAGEVMAAGAQTTHRTQRPAAETLGRTLQLPWINQALVAGGSSAARKSCTWATTLGMETGILVGENGPRLTRGDGAPSAWWKPVLADGEGRTCRSVREGESSGEIWRPCRRWLEVHEEILPQGGSATD